MRISKKDLIFAFIIGAALIFLFAGTGKKLGKDVPEDEHHLVFYRQLEEGENRIALEKECVSCHAIPSLSKVHPHKEECMVCHLPGQ